MILSAVVKHVFPWGSEWEVESFSINDTGKCIRQQLCCCVVCPAECKEELKPLERYTKIDDDG